MMSYQILNSLPMRFSGSRVDEAVKKLREAPHS